MDQAALAEPVTEDNPCGADLQWDPDMMALSQAMLAAVAEDDAVVDGERVAHDGETFDDVVRLAEALCTRTKDLRVLGILAEARWHAGGIADFAETMEAVAVIVETWPDGRTGIHPRADEEDGDLGERAAPLGKLLYRVPVLAHTLGWGPHGEGTAEEQTRTAQHLHQVFTRWEDRLGPAFGATLPSVVEAWQALRPFAPNVAEPEAEQATDAVQGDVVAAASVRTTDPWELIERAEELMRESAPHSPALPVLGMLLRWRHMSIIEVMVAMRDSGITMEQLLEAMRVQTEQLG